MQSIADMASATESGKREIAEQTGQLRELQARAAGLTRVNHVRRRAGDHERCAC